MQQQEREQQIEQLRGRGRWSQSEARYVLETLEASGEPLTRFARRMKLGAQRVRWWKKRLGKDGRAVRGKAAPELAGFVPVVLKAEVANRVSPPAAAVLVVEGARVELRELNAASAMWAASLLEKLQERP